MGILYQLTSPSGKRYIGVTTQRLSARWGKHRSDARLGSDTPVHRAIRKYGAESFRVDVLALIENNLLHEIETRVISALRPEYNTTLGGEGATGHIHSDASRSKMSNAKRGRVFTTEHRDAMRAAKIGKLHTAATRNKISASMRGKKHTRETLLKMSESSTKLWQNADYRQKQAEVRQSSKIDAAQRTAGR